MTVGLFLQGIWDGLSCVLPKKDTVPPTEKVTLFGEGTADVMRTYHNKEGAGVLVRERETGTQVEAEEEGGHRRKGSVFSDAALSLKQC